MSNRFKCSFAFYWFCILIAILFHHNYFIITVLCDSIKQDPRDDVLFNYAMNIADNEKKEESLIRLANAASYVYYVLRV